MSRRDNFDIDRLVSASDLVGMSEDVNLYIGFLRNFGQSFKNKAAALRFVFPEKFTDFTDEQILEWAKQRSSKSDLLEI